MAYVPGTAASEALYGTNEGDSILGVIGHDTLWGYAGADVLRGGVGNDVLYSHSGSSSDSDVDRLYGDGGNDYLVVGSGDYAYGGVGRDTIEAAGDPPALISGDGGYDTLILRYGSGIAGTRIVGVERLEGNTYSSGGGLAASQFSSFATVGAVSGSTVATFHLTAGGSGRINFDRALQEADIYGSTEAQTLRVTEAASTSLHYHGSTGASTVFGGAGADTLEGGYVGDSLRGGEGDDVLAGYGSGYYSDGVQDRLLGEGGNDYIYAAGADWVYGGSGRDTVEARGSDAPAYLNGGDGTDTLRVNGANISESFIGELERLVLVGTVRMDVDQFSQFARIGVDEGDSSVRIQLQQGGVGQILFDTAIEEATIFGTDSADETLRMVGRATPDVRYSGGDGRTLFEAGGGDDSLSGGRGADTLSGGTGNDTIENYTWVYDDDVQDRLSGGDGADLIRAGNGDIVDGGTGNDWISAVGAVNITAGDGHDLVVGSTGDDRIDGGAGSDTVSYEYANSAVNIDLNVAAQANGGGGLDTLIGFENVIGTNRDDTIIGTAGANILEGGGGDDSLYAGAGRDTASYSTSTQAVTVDLRVADPQDTGGAGIDLLSGFENLTGGSGNDALFGDARSNVLIGGEGNDFLNGRLGFDIVSYENATERVQVSLAIRDAQPVGGNNGTDTIFNVEGLRGTAFGDGLRGDNGANVLAGLDGADVLVASAGDDTLNGGAGADRMRGGLGSDTFAFDRTTDSSWDARDVILDFSRADGDRIDLSGIDARPLAGDQAFAFGSTRVGGLSLAEDGADTLVLGNTDRDRDFELAIVVHDGAVRASAYTVDDFVWG